MAGRISHLLQRANPLRLLQRGGDPLNPKLKLSRWGPGSSNLEVIKFGIYIMFPIGWMYYFGTNLENRFSVPDFWPAPGTTNKIPFEREEQRNLEKKLRELRLARKERRKERERLGLVNEGGSEVIKEDQVATEVPVAVETEAEAEVSSRVGEHKSTFDIGGIGRWFKGQ